MPKQKLIVSLYDYTGNWVQDYIDAGYAVMLWDKQVEGCILEGLTQLMIAIEESGLELYGLFAACPCTDFAGSGARWWKGKDVPTPGYEPFISTTDFSTALVLVVLHLVDMFKPAFSVKGISLLFSCVVVFSGYIVVG